MSALYVQIAMCLGAAWLAGGVIGAERSFRARAALRWVEAIFPARVYAWSRFRFRAAEAPDQASLIDLLRRHDVSLRELSFGRSHDGAILEFSGNVMAANDRALDALAASLRELASLAEFELSRISK
jgi:hypothetical protein